jgi:hypothetical protein
MSDIEISSIREFMTAIENDTIEYAGVPITKAQLYRGVPNNKEHKLIPSIGRDWKGTSDVLRNLEKGSLNEFKKRAIPYLNYHPKNDWEWLMLAQHHGLPTRLLDWTTNPLVALYFACTGDQHLSQNGVVYRRRGYELFQPENFTNETLPSPFYIDKNYLVFPPHISPRITAQAAVFVINKNPIEELQVNWVDKEDTNDKVLIKATAKKKLLLQLHDLNINAGSLFPGLEGLCSQIKDENENSLKPVIQGNDP